MPQKVGYPNGIMASGGRRTKFTAQVVERITTAIQLGATYEDACNYAGITYMTFNRWMKAKSKFCEAVKEAEGQATVQWLAIIQQEAIRGNWQAAAWKLERRYPDRYGRQVIDHQSKGQAAILAPLSPLVIQIAEQAALLKVDAAALLGELIKSLSDAQADVPAPLGSEAHET